MTTREILAEIDGMMGDAAGFHTSTAQRLERLGRLRGMVEALPVAEAGSVEREEVLKEEEFTDGVDTAGSGRSEGAHGGTGDGGSEVKKRAGRRK